MDREVGERMVGPSDKSVQVDKEGGDDIAGKD